jgi:DNA mismatch endonuclease (patch repair protein)
MDTLTPKQRSNRMRLIKSEHTTPERAIQGIVRKLGVRFRSHVRGLPGRPDIVISSMRKIVLVHGCFWHRHRCKAGRRMPKTNMGYWTHKFQRNRLRDSEVSRCLQSLGWKVLVVWECQLRHLDKLESRIREFLG